MIHLNDTFNRRLISRHRTVKAAVAAKFRHLAAVKRANGANSYLPYSITTADGKPVDEYEVMRAEHELESGR